VVVLKKANETDEELMRRVQADDARAFGELYDRHVARALKVARSVGHQSTRAEDAVQEGFLSVWRSRGSYQPGMGSFRAWAMTIIRHRAVDSIRSDRAVTRAQAADPEEGLPDRASASLQDEAIERSERQAVRVSLTRLPEAQAEVIALAFFGELSHTEIAAQLSLPAGTVKGRMRLGLTKLRKQMEAAG
jgi:RNA polymerase sigma-70 factor, ECF subfamily